MKTNYYFLILLTYCNFYAQVGINNTSPNATLDIRSSNQVTPANTDGILIPKIDAFPITNPTAAQQGMLVYLTTTVGLNTPGFYYWDSSWTKLNNLNGTLDQAYDFGGAGSGRTITADAGAILINGSDGLVSTGTLTTGALAPTGAGTKLFWNPRKAAFRSGFVNGTQWDDINIGNYSIATGFATIANGFNSIAFGDSTIASGFGATAFGKTTTSAGNYSTTFGGYTTASGIYSIAFGSNTSANGGTSTAFGETTFASGFVSTAFGENTIASGIVSTAFGLSTQANGANSTAFGSSSYADGFNSTAFGFSNISSSFGETVFGVGSTTYAPSLNGNIEFRNANATDRLFTIGNALDANNNAIVDFSERSDAIIVLKNGLTRLPSTTNAMINAADGKAVATKEWVQSNTGGTLDQAYDFGGAGSGRTITADAGALQIDGLDGFVSTGTAGNGAFAPTGVGTKMYWNPRKAAFRAGYVNGSQWDNANVGFYSAAFGYDSNASGYYSTAFGRSSTSSGPFSLTSGYNNTASSDYATAFGNSNIASGNSATALGAYNTASGYYTSSLGTYNISTSYSETIMGIGATTYSLSVNGESEFRNANSTDRLFTIGNAIDTNNNSVVDFSERSNAITVLKNGNTAIGNINPQARLHVSTINSNPVIIDAGANMFVTLAESGVNKAYIGSYFGNANDVDFGTYAGNTGALHLTTNSTERLTVLNNGNIGIGTTLPVGQFQLSLDQGRKPGTNTWTIVSDSRLKNIYGKYTKGLTEILQLNPILYNYKNGNRIFEKEVLETQYSGFSAQEVLPIFPEAVGKDADGFLNFNMHPILVAQVNAIKELNEKNNKLEDENVKLKAEMELLSKKMNSILIKLEHKK